MRSDTMQPIPAGASSAVARVPEVAATTGVLIDQVKVNGKDSNLLTDTMNGVAPANFARLYAVEWVDGDDSALDRLRGNTALVEEQFAKAHGVGVGDSYRIETPSRGKAELRVDRRLPRSPAAPGNDRLAGPFQRHFGGARPMDHPGRRRARTSRRRWPSGTSKRRSQSFPVAAVESRAELQRRRQRRARPVRVPALRAARNERRHLAVRNRELAVPLDPRAHARVRPSARRRRDPRPGQADGPLRERDHRRDRRAARNRHRPAVRIPRHAVARRPRARLRAAARAAGDLPAAGRGGRSDRARSSRRDAAHGCRS